MRSKVEHAIQFQDWVCEEVIPSIRKTGEYNVNPVTQLGDEELERLAAPEPEKPEEAESADTQDATEGLVPADIPDGDLVVAVALPEFQPTEVHRDNRVWYDAREIHAYVQSKQRFADWIQNRIAEIGAVEGVDYLNHKIMIQVPHQGGFRNATQIDYYVTPEMGQELGMLERNARGRVIRLWFIARNQKLESMEANPIIQLADILDNPALNSQLMLELTHRVQKLKQENQIQAQDIEVKAEKITQLEERVEELLPAEKALELLADDPRAKTLKETAGRLRIRLKDLTRFMCQNGWIYKTNYARNSGEPWLGFRQKLASGLLIQSNYDRPTEYGTHSHYGVKVTQKGLIKLAKLLSIDLTKLPESDGMVVMKLAGLQVIKPSSHREPELRFLRKLSK